MILLASDYDNTLNTFDYDLKFNIIFLKKFIKNGNLFLLNTGRTYKSIKREIDKYNIPFNYLSCNDGNIMFNREKEIIYTSNMDLEIKDELRKLKNKFNIEINPIYFNNNLLEFELIIPRLTEIFYLELNKIMLKYNMCCKIFKKVNCYHVYVYSDQISKSTPIEYLKNKYNIDSKNIYTVGDHINDIEMIKDYNGYAMKWAKKEVKDVAVDTCLTVASLIKKIGR